MTQLTLIESALQRAAAVSSLLQGEVLGVADACVVLAEATAPLSAEAADIAASAGTHSGLIVVPYPVDDVVLLTQTFDMQFTTAAEHRCLLAPVMHVSEQVAYEALRGRRPGLAGLPWIGPTVVADLSRITSVERSVIVGAISQGHPRNPQERFHFAETISRYLTRPALPDAVNEVLSPFVKRILPAPCAGGERRGASDLRGPCLRKRSGQRRPLLTCRRISVSRPWRAAHRGASR